AILSRYERREAKDELIPGLRRDHMPLAVLSAVVLAATDVAAAAAESRPADALAREILARADAAYAMPDERPWVRRRAEEIAALIAEAPFDTWRTLSGPYWELWDAKGRFTRRAEASPVGYSLDEQGRIVIGHVRSTEHEA
ncbi:MAG TPA: hypothetical protein VJP88_09075, partial [Caulobacteraceae bacterium]|nr:hypothetical protein [Caulobacteraceae bacterium]